MIVLVIIPEEFEHLLVSDLMKSLILLRVETRLEEDDCVLVAIADKALVLLAQFPVFASIVVEVLLVFKVIVV